MRHQLPAVDMVAYGACLALGSTDFFFTFDGCNEFMRCLLMASTASLQLDDQTWKTRQVWPTLVAGFEVQVNAFSQRRVHAPDVCICNAESVWAKAWKAHNS